MPVAVVGTRLMPLESRKPTTGKTAIVSTAVVVNTGISESVLAGAVPQSVLAPRQPVPMPEKGETLAGKTTGRLGLVMLVQVVPVVAMHAHERSPDQRCWR